MPIYFMHIPKTAGSSVEFWLRNRVAGNGLCPAKNWDLLVALGSGAKDYEAFSGHFGSDLASYLGRSLTTATVLRDPFARTRSHYLHVARDANHPRHAYVSQQTFSAYVEDSRNWPMIDNFQARYLVRSPIDFAAYCAALDRTGVKKSMLSVLSEEARYLLDDAYVREQSFAALSALDVVGTTHRLPAFLGRVFATFRLLPTTGDTGVPVENAAPQDQVAGALSSSAEKILQRLTRIDRDLFEAAERMQFTSLTNTPSVPMHDVSGLERTLAHHTATG